MEMVTIVAPARITVHVGLTLAVPKTDKKEVYPNANNTTKFAVALKIIAVSCP